MRRKEREITDRTLMEQVLAEEHFCRIALCEDNKPYMVPMNFGYEGGCLYLHSACEGKKIDILKKNPNLCFEVDRGCQAIPAESPCNWSMEYCSIIGFGEAIFVEEPEEKKKGLDIIVKKYLGKPYNDYPEEMLRKLVVIKVKIKNLTGKMSEG